MIRMGCIPTELLLERQAPELSHAERLRVEGHLAECEHCRREHGALLSLRSMVEERILSTAKASLQERVIARALLKSGSPLERHAASAAAHPSSFGLPRLAWGLALAAALALVFVGVRRYSGEETVASATQPASGQVSTGKLLLGNAVLAAGDAIPEGRELRPQGGVLVKLAHAELAIESAESLVWSAKERAVTLRNSVTNVNVDATRRQSFQIVTPHFIIDVLGTRFRIAHETVSVEHGRVRVSSLDRQPIAELGPGESWTFRSEPPSASVAAAPLTPPSAESATAASPAKPQLNDSALRAVPASVADLLARARHRLAAGDTRSARTDLDAALAAGGSRSQQAEAQMLRGDCALVDGDTRAAVRTYLDVSQRFGGLRVAETALFTAARVESNRGNKLAARELLQSYRNRYPAGQFRSDVDARLRMLDGK